ncbi:MAG TPA: phosphoribosylaminoimidazolesuccinocarboxamide synthase [candidate division Zixibacteria bacterium]|nr:phosphoribosylaminoimidazolesuccinocarboxamide synthase [candidate division Zixibacteria bacterium]
MKEILQTNLGRKPDYSGKVRDIYELGDKLLIIATDRLSAYDHILPNGIPGRGVILTEMSQFWFDKMAQLVPNHLITTSVDEFPEELKQYRDQLEGRTMLCRKADRIDIECVARGYLAGSGWKEYTKTGEVCGIALPAGLSESDRLPETIFTPATKAEQGEHDENISIERAGEIIGEELAHRLKDLTLEIYSTAAEFARTKGVIIADTKFEFGFIDGELCLIDEILSPDSSRFWDVNDYEPGRSQASFDKQFVRDWLAGSGFSGEGTPPRLPQDVIEGTIERYLEIKKRLMG